MCIILKVKTSFKNKKYIVSFQIHTKYIQIENDVLENYWYTNSL